MSDKAGYPQAAFGGDALDRERAEMPDVIYADTSHVWLHENDGALFAYRRDDAPAPAQARRDCRLEWFMRIMAQVKIADSTDHPSNWIQAFCDDRGNDDDTFNVAKTRRLIRSWYDGDTDHGECEITDAGNAFVAALIPDTESGQ